MTITNLVEQKLQLRKKKAVSKDLSLSNVQSHVIGLGVALQPYMPDSSELPFFPREESIALEWMINRVLSVDYAENRVYIHGVPGTGKSITTWYTLVKWLKEDTQRSMLWIHFMKNEPPRFVFGRVVEGKLHLIAGDCHEKDVLTLIQSSPASVLVLDAMNEIGTEKDKKPYFHAVRFSSAGERKADRAAFYISSGKFDSPKPEEGGFTKFEMTSWTLEQFKESCVTNHTAVDFENDQELEWETAEESGVAIDVEYPDATDQGNSAAPNTGTRRH